MVLTDDIVKSQSRLTKMKINRRNNKTMFKVGPKQTNCLGLSRASFKIAENHLKVT